MTDEQKILALTIACGVLGLLLLRASFIAAVRGARLRRLMRELE